MASFKLTHPKGFENVHKLYYKVRSHILYDGTGKNLPDAYKRYFLEYNQQPKAVHYVPEKGKYKRNPDTGEVHRVQNIPLRILFPKASHSGIWGGEGVIQGFKQRTPQHERCPYYWAPRLKQSVVYSEVLDKYFKTVVTDRTLQLINEHYGFDHYLLQSPACDLQSDLALKIKRKILLALDKNELPHEDAKKREDVYNTYKHYLEKYDSEYIEWYGLSVSEAISKFNKMQQKLAGKPVPLKVKYRQELIQELRTELEEKQSEGETRGDSGVTSFLSKINPFSKSS